MGIENQVLSLLEIDQAYNILKKTVYDIDDKFMSNSKSFLSHIPENQSPTKPFECLINFAKQQQVENLKKRVLKNIALIPLYVVAAFMSIIKQDNKNFAADALYITLALITSIAESVEKRNLATIGHTLDRIGKEVVKTQQLLVKELNLNDADKNQIEILLQKSLLPTAAAFLRCISYFSGFALILCKVGYEILHKDEIIKNSEVQDKGNKEGGQDIEVLFGLMSIAMPLVNTLIWFAAASVRQMSFDMSINNYHAFSQILDNASSYNNSELYEKIIATLKKYNSENINDNKCFTSDHWTNPGKGPAFASWAATCFRRRLDFFPSYCVSTEDLTRPKSSSLTNARMGTWRLNNSEITL